MTEYTGNFTNTHGKIAIVVAKFNEIVTKNLVRGAKETLHQFGIQDDEIDVIWVPGAFEIGFTAQKLIKSDKYAGLKRRSKFIYPPKAFREDVELKYAPVFF